MMDRTTLTIRCGGTRSGIHDSRISLPCLPGDAAEIGPDLRHETAPRRRGLVGSRVRQVTEDDLVAAIVGARG